MTALTPAALAEMEQRAREAAQLAEAATPGPWEVWDGPEYEFGGADLCIGAGETWLANMDERRCVNYGQHMASCAGEQDIDICSITDKVTTEQRNNVTFIAASRTAVPALAADVAALLAYVRELEAENAGMALMLAEGAAFAAHPSE